MPTISDSKREYLKQWRAANADKIREYMHAWQVANADRVKANKREYYIANRDRFIQRAKEQYERDPEAIKQRATEWARENRERRNEIASASAKRHPEPKRAAWHRRKAKLQHAEGSFTPEDIERLYARQRGACAACHCELNSKYEIDHIMPIHLGGTNSPANLQLLCRTCNRSKGHKHPDEWAQILCQSSKPSNL